MQFNQGETKIEAHSCPFFSIPLVFDLLIAIWYFLGVLIMLSSGDFAKTGAGAKVLVEIWAISEPGPKRYPT
jgi:hypothetical protein